MRNHKRARLIGLDWGSSSCRAYLMGEGGGVISERREQSGVMAVTARAAASGAPYEVAFEQTFERLCGEWLANHPGLPVIACGMVGSNHGWAEAEYRSVPADLAAIGIVLTPVRTRTGATVHIIPGLISDSARRPAVRPGSRGTHRALRRTATPAISSPISTAGPVSAAAASPNYRRACSIFREGMSVIGGGCCQRASQPPSTGTTTPCT